MRVITDPVVDIVAFFVVDLLLPPLFRIIRRFVAYASLGVMHLTTKTLGRNTADGITRLTTKLASTFSLRTQIHHLIRGLGKSLRKGCRQVLGTHRMVSYHD
jgi:hypothetical protein